MQTPPLSQILLPNVGVLPVHLRAMQAFGIEGGPLEEFNLIMLTGCIHHSTLSLALNAPYEMVLQT
jgi:hypothetical protein